MTAWQEILRRRPKQALMQHLLPPAVPPVPTGRALALGLEFEAIAERYGFVDGTLQDGGFALPVAELAALQACGKPLDAAAAMAACQRFGLHARLVADHLVFDAEADSLAGFRQARHAFRRLWQWLSEENPIRLGRTWSARWGGPRTPAETPEKSLTRSTAWLQRAYRNGFIVPEKKNLVVDFRTSSGMHMASIDQDEVGPLCSVVDSSSQIASLMTGFNMPGLRGVLHHEEAFLNPDYRRHPSAAVEAFRRWLSRQAPPELPYVCFVNSGTEAVEKALGLALTLYKGEGRRVLAFQGSFHGRTLLSLFSSWNPEKRLAFEIAGYESIYVDYPEDKHPHQDHAAPDGWLALWEGAVHPLTVPPAWLEGDPLLAREIASLLAVRDHLHKQAAFAVVVEPFQGEGGDRYVTARFLAALRALTRALGVPLIFDEVQAGMGLSGPVLWHHGLDLRNSKGERVHPDFVTMAKKAQAGVVLSSVPDPRPSAAHVASVLRGNYNAQLIDTEAIKAIEAEVMPRLRALAERHPIVEHPRGRGLAFAFDLPDKATAEALINQRFARGYLVYIAGEKTLRYRLQVTTTRAEIDTIFEAIEESLVRLGKEGLQVAYHPSHPQARLLRGAMPAPGASLDGIEWNAVLREYGQLDDAGMTAVRDVVGSDPMAAWRRGDVTWVRLVRYLATGNGVRVAVLTPQLWARHADRIMAIEAAVYEPARRDTREFFQEILDMPRHVAVVALYGEDGVAGFSLSGPLEFFPRVRGCAEDPENGKATCLYSADVTVAPEWQGHGIGQRMKEAQLELARSLGYKAVRSRNRVGRTGAMGLINRSLGAIEVNWLPDDYGQDHAPCLYSSIPLAGAERAPVDWSNGVEEPTGGRGLSQEDWEDWDLAALHKLSLCNWVTPNYVRYLEWLQAHAPAGLDHLYLSNGRDEASEKAIKSIKYHRKDAKICIGFEGGYWGHTTAGARSLSDAVFRPFFPWPLLQYPCSDDPPGEDADGRLRADETACLSRLRQLLSEPAHVIGVFIEPIQEMTGRWVSVRFLRALRDLCRERDVPLVFNESASWGWRGGPSLFYASAVGVQPDGIVAYGGGQLGHTLMSERYFIPKPLAMISTWDGDELSALRLRAQFRYVEACRDEAFLSAVDARLRDGVKSVTWRGTGRVQGAPSLRRSIADPSEGVLLPPLPLITTQWETLVEALSC